MSVPQVNGKTFIITGAASGIGRQLAKGLVQKGARLLLADLNFEALQAAFRESEDLLLRQMDVTSETAWAELVATTVEAFGQLDYCVNNAGVIRPGFLLDSTPEHIRYHIEVNALGVMYGTHFAAKVMAQQGYGHIINMASLASIAPVQGLSLYSGSKFAVRGFSLAAGYELEDKGVCVSLLSPDLVHTNMLDVQLQYPEESALSFSGGAQPLTVEDVEQAFYEVLRQKPREYCLPASRGWLAKIGSAFPGLGAKIGKIVKKQGLKRIKKRYQKR
jgi:3-oxoacyl-[acyl-carrier protein] reductase